MNVVDLRSTSASSLPMFDRLPGISLAELDATAALQRRVDRKYVVTHAELLAALEQLADRLVVLQIDGRQSFEYRSVYFDTPDLRSFHEAARSRPHRFKVRTRTYVDSSEVMLEVKRRDRRGATVKTRRPHVGTAAERLDPGASRFIDEQVGEAGLAAELRPALVTSYRRTTLLDPDDVARVTVDADLDVRRLGGPGCGLIDRFVVETKSSSRPSAMDRTLWSLGVRPSKISKFGTGLAVLDPSLPSNKWHRTIRRHFGRGVSGDRPESGRPGSRG